MREYEYWLLGSDIGEIHLLSPKPDTDRLHSLITPTATATASSLTSSTSSAGGSQTASREKVKIVSLDFQMLSEGNDAAMLSKGDDEAISQYQLSASAVTSLGNDHDWRNQPGKGTGISNGTSSWSEIGITYTQQPVTVIELISSGIEMLSKGAGANKKRRKAKAKAKGREKGCMGINCHPLSQLGPSSVDYLHSDMQSTPTNSQSNAVMSLGPTLPCVRESILPLPDQFSCTEAESEKSTTECNMSLTKLIDVDPTCPDILIAVQSSSFPQPQVSPTSSNREGEDDYSAIPVPVTVPVSFADMFESLLSEKRKLMQ